MICDLCQSKDLEHTLLLTEVGMGDRDGQQCKAPRLLLVSEAGM